MMTRWIVPIVLAAATFGCGQFNPQPADTRVYPAKESVKLVATARPIANQRRIGGPACGPCAVFNSIAWGDAPLRKFIDSLPGMSPEHKVRGLIATVGAKPS